MLLPAAASRSDRRALPSGGGYSPQGGLADLAATAALTTAKMQCQAAGAGSVGRLLPLRSRVARRGEGGRLLAACRQPLRCSMLHAYACAMHGSPPEPNQHCLAALIRARSQNPRSRPRRLRAEPKSRLYAAKALSAAENRSAAAEAEDASPAYNRDLGYQRLCGSGGSATGHRPQAGCIMRVCRLRMLARAGRSSAAASSSRHGGGGRPVYVERFYE
eukprot:COSAG01_NODE_297_length_19258_cov_8.905110_14_plen_218_part_00